MTTQARTDILNPDRRQLLSQAAMTAVAASVSSLLPLHSAKAGVSGAVRPFHVSVPEQDLLELRRRLAATRWPDREIVADQSQGVQLTTVRQLVSYWQNDYDWRKMEARLNALPQFVTEIDGVDIHFIHIRSRHENALPMVVTHGWPGSIIEQMKIVGPLTDPTAHGAKAADAFDLVIPSLPGHGFSGKPTELGWDPQRIARAWVVLMKRLGYSKFVAQGGDWGSPVSNEMGKLGAPELLTAAHDTSGFDCGQTDVHIDRWRVHDRHNVIHAADRQTGLHDFSRKVPRNLGPQSRQGHSG